MRVLHDVRDNGVAPSLDPGAIKVFIGKRIVNIFRVGGINESDLSISHEIFNDYFKALPGGIFIDIGESFILAMLPNRNSKEYITIYRAPRGLVQEFIGQKNKSPRVLPHDHSQFGTGFWENFIDQEIISVGIISKKDMMSVDRGLPVDKGIIIEFKDGKVVAIGVHLYPGKGSSYLSYIYDTEMRENRSGTLEVHWLE